MNAIRIPHVIDGLSEQEYHAHSALSCSGAKKLLPPSCPAIFKWELDNGRPEKRAFDFGHAAHSEVLGVGQPLLVVDADTWRTKAAQEQQAAAYASGHVPLLAKEASVVKAMGDQLRRHPVAGALLQPGTGQAEQSVFWRDDQFEVDCRARFDFITTLAGGRTCIVDYKSSTTANPAVIGKRVADFGYMIQDHWYRDGAVAALDVDDPAFLFVFQEKTPPYLVTVVELDYEARRVGQILADRAREVYAECCATDTWPSYSNEVELVALPGWYAAQVGALA